LHELREKWTYDDVAQAIAVMDMYAAIELARDTKDAAEIKDKTGR
jgi:hypothetical protein